MTTKITTTPSPLEVVDKINAVIDDATNLSTTVGNKLDKTGKAADAVKADTATTISTTLPIDKGGTGATTAANARTNLGLSTAFTAASISGKVITLTKANGTNQTLTTQDTSKRFYGPTELDSGDFTANYDGFLTVIDQNATNARNIKVYNNGVLMASHYDHHASQAFGITPFKAGDVLSASAPSSCKFYKMELR